MEPELAVSKEGLVCNNERRLSDRIRSSSSLAYPARETSQQSALVAVAVINKDVVVGTFRGHQRELEGNIDSTVVLQVGLYQPLAVTGLYIIIFII